MITSKEVAKIANVSVSTVSRVFSNPALVNKSTIEKVEAIARQLHYVPNIAARNLKLNRSGIIGVVQSDLNNTFYAYILREIFPEIKKHNYRLFTAFSEENADMENSCISTLVASNVDILVFTPVQSHSKYVENVILKNNICSLQLYRRTYDKIDSLTIDDAFGTYIATKELLENNHRNIVLIDYKLEIPTHREEGYQRAFEEKKLSFSKSNIIHISPSDDYDRIIAQKLDEIRPTAIIPVSSIFATSTISYLKQNKLKIKDDVSLIIYDDVSYAKLMDLTVVSHPLHEIAETAANMLFQRIANFDMVPIHKMIMPSLLRRDSVKRI